MSYHLFLTETLIFPPLEVRTWKFFNKIHMSKHPTEADL